jgi:hypothetical protein
VPPITTIFIVISAHATAAQVKRGGNILSMTGNQSSGGSRTYVVFKIDYFARIDGLTVGNTG